MAENTTQTALTILFAELASGTDLYRQAGDEAAHRLIVGSVDRMRAAIEQQQGVLLRTVGDAVLASFDSADNALLAATAMQRCHAQPALALRVGFHHGEVIADGGDLYGSAVNVAARVAAFATGREVFTTQDAVERLSEAHRKTAEFLDRVDFKGIPRPLPVYRIHWDSGNEDTSIVLHPTRSALADDSRVLLLEVGARRLHINANRPVVSFGRAVDNDVVISHHSTSRHHATIEFRGGRHVLRDTSTNGTYVMRTGKPPHLVRRTSHELEQFGTVGFGWPAVESDADRLTYKLLVDGTAAGRPSRADIQV